MATPPVASAFFSQTPDLQHAPTAATPPLAAKPQWSPSQAAIAAAYNRVGGLIGRLAARIHVPPAAVLAVFFVESSGVALKPGQAVIRLEVHHLWSNWGASNAAAFDAHFRFGGHNGVAGKSTQNHAFSVAAGGPFTLVHSSQATEYAAYNLAVQLAGKEVAARCGSIGDCQIMGSNFSMLGYASAQAMFDAFQASENAHILGFFDFCARQPAPHTGGLITALQQGDFATFARFYNGNMNVATYSKKLKLGAADAAAVLGA